MDYQALGGHIQAMVSLQLARHSRQIIDAFRAHYDVSVEQVTLREENVTFKLPRELREVPATP